MKKEKLFILAVASLVACSAIAVPMAIAGQKEAAPALAATNNVEVFKSAEVVSGSSYGAHSNDKWGITWGGNNKSLGTNGNNSSKCNLSSFAKFCVAPITPKTIATAVYNKTEISSSVNKISFSYSGGKNDSGKIFLLHSTDNATFSEIKLNDPSKQGASIAKNMEFSFGDLTGYFAVVLAKSSTSGGDWRFDNVEISFAYENTAELSNISISKSATKTSFYVGEELTCSGLEVTASYSDETTKVLSNEELVFTPALGTKLTKETTEVKIAYTDGEKTFNASYNISVLERNVTEIIVETQPTIKDYAVGDTINLAGLSLTIKYDAGKESSFGPFKTNDEYVGVTTNPSLDTPLTLADTKYEVNYLGKTCEVAITVSEVEKYSKVTSLDNLIVGSKVTITSEDGKNVISATQKAYNRDAVAVPSTDASGDIKAFGGMGVFELGSADELISGAYSFRDSNGYLYSASTDKKSQLKSESKLDASGSWAIRFSEKGELSLAAQVNNTRNALRYNPNNGNPLFSCYASGSQSPVAIYQHAPAEITDSIWADNFLVKIGGACQMSGSTNKETLEHQWNVVKALTDKMDKATLKDVVGNVSGTNIERAIARYEFVASKYGFEDYLGRGVEKTAQAKSYLLGDSKNNSFAIIAGSVFVGAVITIGLFFALKKKKA